ncbi:MAG: alpha/beta hydrolase [Anaerolineae bacterium]|nr:alpha/beta hydrolase [Anaerolineae bacterium]
MGFSIIALLLVTAVLAAAWHFSNLVLHPDTRSPESVYALEMEKNHFPAELFESWPQEGVTLTSPYGYSLSGMYVPLEGSHKTVLILHGIKANRFSMVKYGVLFRELGFNLLLVDHRNHGLSGGDNTSYGFYEKDDTKVWMDWAFNRCPDCIVGTQGESMGAAIALQHAAIDPRVAFVVADCPFAYFKKELAYRLNVEYHLPPFPLLPAAELLIQLRAGFSLGKVSPLDAVASIKAPVLFVHGQEDSFIPPQDSKTLYEAKQGLKQLYLVPGAEHVESLPTDPEGYRQALIKFFEAAGIH